MLFISHDLAVVRSLADTVAVLFRGQLMEIGRNEDVFAPPYHPYTHSLLMAVPSDRRRHRRRGARRFAGGRAADAGERGGACAFAGRCPWQPGPDLPRRRSALAGDAERQLASAATCRLPELAARAEWGRADAKTSTRIARREAS